MEPVVCFAGFAGAAGVRQQLHVANERLPVAWLEGEVLAEYVKFLEETASPPAHPAVVEWMEGEVREEFLRFLADAEDVGAGYGRIRCPAQDSDDDVRRWFLEEALDQAPQDDGDRGSCVVNNDGGSLMDEDDEELEMLVSHILDLPAFRVRAAAAAQQETEPPSPHQGGGWMRLVS